MLVILYHDIPAHYILALLWLSLADPGLCDGITLDMVGAFHLYNIWRLRGAAGWPTFKLPKPNCVTVTELGSS